MVDTKMAANLSTSSQRVLKPSHLTNLRTGQMLLRKGTQGSLAVLGATAKASTSASISLSGENVDLGNDEEFPRLNATKGHLQMTVENTPLVDADCASVGGNAEHGSAETAAPSWAEQLNTECMF